MKFKLILLFHWWATSRPRAVFSKKENMWPFTVAKNEQPNNHFTDTTGMGQESSTGSQGQLLNRMSSKSPMACLPTAQAEGSSTQPLLPITDAASTPPALYPEWLQALTQHCTAQALQLEEQAWFIGCSIWAESFGPTPCDVTNLWSEYEQITSPPSLFLLLCSEHLVPKHKHLLSRACRELPKTRLFVTSQVCFAGL